jgi:hypothetical protein
VNPFESNPFATDPDRAQIWEILIRRDIDAFLAARWEDTCSDFLAAEFFGVDAGRSRSPQLWRLRYAQLSEYRDEWLRQARELSRLELRGIGKREFLLRACALRDIDINGSAAVAHKVFDGRASTTAGEPVQLHWQTLYFLKKEGGRWKIRGFLGYLPNTLQ